MDYSLRIFFPFLCPKSMFVSISGMHFFQATKGWCMLLIQFAICHSMSFDWRNWDNWHSLLILKRLELWLKWWSACFAIMKPWVQTLVLPKKKKKKEKEKIWKVCSISCNFVVFMMFTSFLILICYSTHLVGFILSCNFLVAFIFLFCV
jgi:hypothetical protein